jgi:peptide deformylase
MAIRKIASIGHPVLRQAPRRLEREELLRPEVQRIIDDLIETLRDARAAGLAANQIHEPIQICAIEIPDNPRYPYMPAIPLVVLVNPVIERLGAETFPNFEGCLSVPNLRGVVARACEIRVRGWDRAGHELDLVVRGLAAGAYQHELEHLAGSLFVEQVTDPTTLCTAAEYDRHHAAASAERARAMVGRFGS